MGMSKQQRAAEKARLQAEQTERDENALDPVGLAVDDIAGRRQWNRSKLGFLTGTGTIRDGIGSVFRTGTEATDRVKTLGKAAFSTDKRGRAVDPAVTDPAERFEAAMQANRKSVRDVVNSINNTYRQFWFFVALMGMTLAVGIITLALYGFAIPQFPPFDIAFRLIPMPILGAFTLRAGYTNWMFRRKRLESIGDYLSSGNLLPRKVSLKSNGSTAVAKSSNTIRAVVLAFATLAGLSVFTISDRALAQDTAANTPGNAAEAVTADPDANDIFVQMLAFIIPNVGPVPAPQGVAPAAQHEGTKIAFMIFSGTLMFIAAMVSGWQIMSGLVASAKEGTVLGKLYHEVWAPMRVVFGFGMLAPIAGGLCAAQVVCLYLVVWGSNLANLVWEPYIQVVTYSDEKTAAAQSDETAKNIVGANLHIANSTVQQIFERELCWHTVDTYLSRTNRASDTSLRNPSPTWTTWEPGLFDWMTFNDGRTTEFYDYGSVCGRLEVSIPKTIGADTEHTAEINAGQNVLQHMARAQLAQVKAIQAGVTDIAQEIAQTYQIDAGATPRYFLEQEGNASQFNELRDVLKMAREGYVTAVGEAAKQASQMVNPAAGGADEVAEFRQAAIKSGWAASGVFYVSIGRLQNAVYSGATKAATFSRWDPINAGNTSDHLGAALIGTEEQPGAIPAFNSWWGKNINFIATDISSQAVEVANQSGMLGDMLTPVFLGLTDAWRTKEDVNPLNPMQHMIDMGNKLMFWGGASYLAANTVIGGIDAAQNQANRAGPAGLVWGWAADVGKATLGAVMSLASMGAIAMLIAGAVHAYVLPMIPYIMTVFFISAMALLTAEALVAAPLWAFFHIRMDGQEFMSDVQKPGYMIAFNLILRPALMIFGLILSYLVFGAMAWFVEKTFYPAAHGLSASTAIGPLATIVLIVMVTYLHFQLAVRAFSMILQVPDRVTRWFGQGGERLGEEEDSAKIQGFVVGSTNRLEGISKAGHLGRGGGGGRVKIPGAPGGDVPGGGGAGAGGGGGAGGPPATGGADKQRGN